MSVSYVIFLWVNSNQIPDCTSSLYDYLSPWSPVVSRGKKRATAELFTLGRITSTFRFHGKQVTRDHVVCCRAATLQQQYRASSSHSSSLLLSCSSHRELVELRLTLNQRAGLTQPALCIVSKPPRHPSAPLFRRALRSSRACSRWAAVIAQRTNKCCCLAGELRSFPVWVVCFGSVGPWGPRPSFMASWASENSPRSVMEAPRDGELRNLQGKTNREVCSPFADCSLIIPGPLLGIIVVFQ